MSSGANETRSATDDYIRKNAEYAKQFSGSTPAAPSPSAPKRHVAIVACMDARLDVYRLLGVEVGDAHVIRNAGGVVTEDVLRSLVISQRLLGTREIVLVHHTDCGMVTFTDDELKAKIAAETGSTPPYSFHAFADIAEDVRSGIERIQNDPHLPHRDRVRGFSYDVATGRLHEIFPVGA